MRINRYRAATVILMAILVFTTACANQNEGREGTRINNQQMRQQLGSEPQTLEGGSTTQAEIQLQTHQNKNYVSLAKLAEVLEFNTEWDEATQTYNLGLNDVIYQIKVNSTQATKEEQTIDLETAPITIEGETLLPEEAIGKLFTEEISYEIRDNQLIIYPSNNTASKEEIYEEDESQAEDELSFEDDPNDPATNDEEVWNPAAEDNSSVEVLKNINMNSLIGTGKQYLGVKYKFGAEPYSQSKRFDCSSFTQQLYAKYGVDLNRLARGQAKQGNSVSRKSLRKGDLLFFSVPGRFRSNKTVGHVGIYMGNKKMIHSSPEPKNGVQITSINKNFWKKTYLGAKRVAY